VIIGIAIKQGDLTIALPKPNRHHHCIHYAVKELGLKGPVGHDGQGFYLKSGKYLTREEALAYAIEHGQVEEGKTHSPSQLFSEDLW
jgi:hypothetical protein